MDTEKIKRIVDGYIAELAAEFGRYAKEMVSSAEGVEKEIDDMCLPKDMFAILWDPQAILYVSKAACTLHTERIFQLLEGMDPEEEQAARRMIAQKLHGIVDELSSGMNLQEASPDEE
ncbi:MAG: hypothetical protein Q8R30_01605 [bacterium]|nr:hypothetical protein [bacterium]